MEHRWSVRKPQQCRVVVDTPSHGRVGARALDIGIGGMLIATDGIDLPPNTALSVAFSLLQGTDREDFRLPALVVRRAMSGVGVMFLDIDVNKLRALRRALHESDSSEREHDLPTADVPHAGMMRLPRVANG